MIASGIGTWLQVNRYGIVGLAYSQFSQSIFHLLRS